MGRCRDDFPNSLRLLRFLLFQTDSVTTRALFAKADGLSREEIGAAIEAHCIMGPGLLESIYERCLLRGSSYAALPLGTRKRSSSIM
jgi:hypothetical protein